MKKLFTLFALLVTIVIGAKAADITYALTDFSQSTSGSTTTYTSEFSEAKWKNNRILVELPSASVSGTVDFKCKSSNTSRFQYIYKTNGTEKDETRKVQMTNGYSGSPISYTSNDILTDGGKYYLVFQTGDDFKATGIKFTVPAATEKYTVTFDAGTDGSCATASLEEASAGAGVTLPEVTGVTSGKAFTGWYTAASGGTLAGVAGATYHPSANTDLYAQYVTISPYTTPTITEINGTVQITSPEEVDGKQIKYSLDGGTTYSNYTIPFNLSTATTVKAYVTGTSAAYTDSEVAEQSCGAIPAAAVGSSSITLYYNTTDMTAASSTPKGLTGNTGTDYEGWGITLNSTAKDLSSGSDINGNKSLKGSNAVQVIITMPEGVKANRITIYSYNNGDFTATSLWSEVAGASYDATTEIGLESKSPSTPDVRVFTLNDVEGTLTLTNNGTIQQCFTAVVDYTAPVVPSISAENVNISKDATNDGEIEFTVNNPVEGGSVSATKNEEATWLTLGEVDNTNGKVPFTATANTESAGRTATVTLTYTYNTNETVTKEVTIAQAADVTGTAIIKATLTAKNAATVTGTIGGTANVNLQSTQDETGGYKFGGKGNYFGVTLENGTFQAGDVINVHTTTTAQQGTIAIYDSSAGTNLLYDTGVYMTSGTAGALENTDNKFALPAAVNGKSTIYVCRTEANNWNGYVDYIEVTRPNATITLNANGFATYSNAEDFEFAGAQAYKMALTTTSLKGTEVTGKIPAGEGILFKGTPNATVSIINTTGASAITGNDLKGTTDADGNLVDKGSNHYYALKGDTFKPYTGAAFAPNKAYFETSAQLNSIDMQFDDAPTAVEAVAEAKVNVNVPVKVIKNGQLFIGNYNVAGQRVK